MTRTTRRSGYWLIILAMLGAFYFWITDPRLGPEGRPQPSPNRRIFKKQISVDPRHWLYVVRGSEGNPIDAANTAQAGTFVGIAGCVVVLGIGAWLLTRRTV